MFDTIAIVAPVLAIAQPADIAIDIPAGTLGAAVLALGAQTGASIGVADPSLRGLPTPALRGRFTVAQALARLLRGLPVRAVGIDRATYRLVGTARPAKPPAVPRALSGPPVARADIVVTASRRDTRLDVYPGGVAVIGSDAGASGTRGGSDAIVARLPALSSTQLGPGRNKLFIGGVADSSFNGPTQATVGQYLGELRLTYNAPDPDLMLRDMASVEVLAGPQGTLYGAGSLGGIVRLVPQPVALGATEAALAAEVSATAHGAGGTDVAAVVNLPLAGDWLGLRAVAYRRQDDGYIDDAARGLTDVNRTRTAGGRAAIAAAAGAWTLTGTLALQYIDSTDGQYAERGLPPLAKASAIAQPFDNDYLLAGLVARRGWAGGLSLTSATAIVSQSVAARYDFTLPAGTPRAFDQANHIDLISNETRLSRAGDGGPGWLIGSSLLLDDEALTRTLGGTRITGVRNLVAEAAAYGELDWRLRPDLTLTTGGRVSYDHLSGRALDRVPDVDGGHDDRDQLRLLPSLALSWRPAPRLIIYARYDEGFRPGGLAVAGEDENGAVERFRGDTVETLALGARIARDRWDASMRLSFTRWRQIQADLVDGTGLPFTANLGDGLVRSAEAQVRWHPGGALTIDAALAVNDSDLDAPAPAFAASRDAGLPNVPAIAARAGVSWRYPLSHALAFTIDGWARYVGRSRLGVGPVLDIGQGGYVDDAVRLRVGGDRSGVALSASNLADARGNRFAFGDPFTVADRRQVTPLRPRTVTIGVDARF